MSDDGIFDPYETGNRKVHGFNRGLDRALVRPAAIGYSTILPDEVEDSIGNFASNLGEPSIVVNSLLQGDLRGAGNSTLRFLTNSTLGLFGFFDVANEFKMVQHDTDFGETLHVWGVREGAYLELPVLGPSTTRDTVGLVVDLFTNPFSYTVDEPEAYYGTVASVASSLSTRGRLTETIDAILYDSADSYAQARLIYLQNRRFELGQDDPSAEIDPFALDTEGF
ncbi:MAG: VacJ family lipoprotein [Pseudomonadota bacterium]